MLVTIVCISRNVASSLVSDDVRVCRYVCVSSRTHTEMHDNERIRPRVRGGLYNQQELQGNKKENHESAQNKLKIVFSSRQT